MLSTDPAAPARSSRAVPTADRGGSLLGLVVPVLLVYLASRLLAAAAVAVAAGRLPGLGAAGVVQMWDGVHYTTIAGEGYPLSRTEPQPPGWPVAAFFPLYPVLVRGAAAALPGGVVEWGVALSLLAGAAAAVLVALLGARLGGRAAGIRAGALFSLAPGAFVLSLVYAEALMVAGSAACLLLLAQHRWLLAGLAAGLTTAVRPNALVLVGACGVAALVAIVREREWRSLVAPALAPAGVLAYYGYLGARTGDLTFWYRVQREVWAERIDLGAGEAASVGRFVAAPLDSDYTTFAVVGLVAAAVGLAVVAWARLPLEQVAFAAGVVLLPAVSAALSVTPRFLFTAFPVALALGVRTRGVVFAVLLAGSAVLMPLLLVTYAVGSTAGVAGPPAP